MAKLQKEQLLKLIANPKYKEAISLAVHQEERLVMHCEPILEKYNLPPMAFRDFTMWWQSLISREKYNRIKQLIGTPLSTLSVTKDIFDQLGKFIDAQDRYVEYKFVTEDYTNDYNDYLEKINDDSFWKQHLVDALKTQINSFIVIDLPQEQITKRPEPYQYLVSISQVHDVEINKINGNVEYIIFRQPDCKVSDYNMSNPAFALISESQGNSSVENLIVIDDEKYRIVSKIQNDPNWIIHFESDHGLGYCPVIDFWSKAIKKSNGINKKGPITSLLRKLDYLLFYRALADYMDLFGPFPVLVEYDTEDEEFDQKNKEVNYGNDYQMDMFSMWDAVPPANNPRQATNKLLGPGGRKTVAVPASSQDHDMMVNPMKFIGMEVDSLEHVQKRINQLENEIIEACTGEDKEYMNEMTKNPQMLNAQMEVKDTIFTSIKREFERCHRFLTKTRTDLRYGRGYLQAATIDYGSDYFLKDAIALVNEYKDAAEAGMSQSYTDQISQGAAKTRNKNNPEVLARMRILSDLEPYKNLSFEQLMEMQLNVSDKVNFIIKINFLSFISRFELENGSIVRFGDKIPYPEKISIIKKRLVDYAGEIKWVDPTPKEATTKSKTKTKK